MAKRLLLWSRLFDKTRNATLTWSGMLTSSHRCSALHLGVCRCCRMPTCSFIGRVIKSLVRVRFCVCVCVFEQTQKIPPIFALGLAVSQQSPNVAWISLTLWIPSVRQPTTNTKNVPTTSKFSTRQSTAQRQPSKCTCHGTHISMSMNLPFYVAVCVCVCVINFLFMIHLILSLLVQFENGYFFISLISLHLIEPIQLR